jgi:hypothetical protein
MAIIFNASLHRDVSHKYCSLFPDPDDKPNVLVSPAYNMNDWLSFLTSDRHMIGKITGDSGAYSAASGTSDISLQQIMFFFKKFGDKFDWYANFDSSFSKHGFEENISNQLKMERKGLTPVPVVHNFFTKEIEYYAKSGKYPVLALGSSQSTNLSDFQYAVNKIKSFNPDIKIHWFGGSKFDWMTKVPVYSSDTSSWAFTGKFGNINFFNPETNRTDVIYIGGRAKQSKEAKYHFLTYPWKEDVKQYLWDNFKFTHRDLNLPNGGNFNKQVVNLRFFVKHEKRINQERIRRGVPLE